MPFKFCLIFTLIAPLLSCNNNKPPSSAGAVHAARQDPTSPPATGTDAVRSEYLSLLTEIRPGNRLGMDSWTMNCEHLFADEGELRDRVIAFVRRPQALDLLYARLLEPQADPEEILVVVQLLVYHGQYHLDGDELLSSTNADAVDRAIAEGRPSWVLKQYPALPVLELITYSVGKSKTGSPLG
jgi:hypothetical protein